MKRYILLLIIIIGVIFTPTCIVNASSSVTVNIKSTSKTANKGETINVDINIKSPSPIGYYEYTLDYNQDNLKLVSGTEYNVDKLNDNDTRTINKSFKFKVLKDASNTISIKSYLFNDTSDKKLNVTVNALNISSSKQTKASDNNYLSKLSVENFKLDPKFNKNTFYYSLEINKNVEKINIIAKAEDSNAQVNGDGEFELLEGENKFEIVVTSESGKKKTYTIIINPSDNSDTVSVVINEKTYSVIKNIDILEIPSGYDKKEITIEGKKVTALYNEKLGYTLVGLKDENNNINLYIYDKDNNTYSLYQEIKIDEFSFIPVKTNESFKDYTSDFVTINDITIDCYRINNNSKFAIIYGINTKTNEKGWYVYSEEENTIQKYNNDIDEYYNEKISNSHTLIYILMATTFIFGLFVIILAIRSKRRKK